MDERLIFGMVVAGGWQFVGHYLPFPRKLIDIHPTVAYVWGVVGILLGCAVWLRSSLWLGIAGICAAAGIVTVLSWLWDSAMNGAMLRRNEARHERKAD